ncbi:MAG: cytochrome ubiquinol oxidase subunit I [Bacteroidota bacterium]|nr:cytochrome ubiquinol oxidase subunit I [Bacteroidota bacterium]
MDNIDISLVDWSRAQFALTAFYHWLFVPLTLGLSFIIAFMETLYVRTGNPEWKRITKFWMILFGINFAIGVATGIILEFEFGTNWTNYSWFVGDIFGAPLAVEGIMAFFLESTFIAVMFFGWNKVSKKFHLMSTWLVAFGANLSALWILVANAWMQNPVGMRFNPDTARNEMQNFWEVLFSPTAIGKFLHTITSGYVLAAIFVIGISAFFLLKKRHVLFAQRSIAVAAVFGLLSAAFLTFSGDSSAREVARVQPMKFAAMEGLYEGQTNAPLVAIGIFEKPTPPGMEREFAFKIEIPNMLSYMAFLSPNAFVPGIRDLVRGNPEQGIESYFSKMERGKKARQALADYKKFKKEGNEEESAKALKVFEKNYDSFGYSYYDDPQKLIPNVPLNFYAFHAMVILGVHFGVVFLLSLIFLYNRSLHKKRWFLWISFITIPFAWLATMLGWTVAEMGRQPWVIQDLMPTLSAVSNISSTNVKITFYLFAVLFTALLVAEFFIMRRQILKGPKEEGGN